jgi:hypothetical protein
MHSSARCAAGDGADHAQQHEHRGEADRPQGRRDRFGGPEQTRADAGAAAGGPRWRPGDGGSGWAANRPA